MDDSIITITRFVSAYRRKMIAWRIAGAGLIAITIFFALFAVLQLIFALFPWTILPLVFDSAFLCLCLFIAGSTAAATTFGAPDFLSVARAIERRSDIKKPLLSISCELARDRQTRDNPFTVQACERAAAGLSTCPRSPLKPRSVIHLLAVALVLGLWCFLNHYCSPQLLDYWNMPFSHFSQSGIVISPGSIVVPMNATVYLRLVPGRSHFPSCRCAIFSPEGERLSNVLLRSDSSGGFMYRIDSVKNTFDYRFTFGGIPLRTSTVTVVPPPRLVRVNVTLRPPAYTRRPERRLPEGQGNFEAYAGSVARISVESNRLSRAWLVRTSHRDSLGLAVTGAMASGEIKVAAPCTYTFALVDTLGQKSDSLPVFHIGCIPDEPPTVQIIKPGFSKDLQPEQVETLAVEGVDDIGIRSLAIKWHLSGGRSDGDGERDLSSPGVPSIIRTAFIWHLTELSMYPGDTVFYWAEIYDTKPSGNAPSGNAPSGKPRTGQAVASDTFFFRIPGFEEIHRQLAEREDHIEKTMGAIRGKQGELQEQLERVVKAMEGGGSKKELTWEQKQILRDVRQELKAQADSLKQTVQSLRENVEKMKQEGTAGDELSQKFDKVRKAVEELVRQYGDSLLFTMKDIDKPVSMREMRQAIEKLTSMLPKLGEQLDNVLKFLEMLKEDRKLAELALRAEQLSKEQKLLARSEDGQARQKELLDQIRRLTSDLSAQSRRAIDSLQSKSRVDSLRRAMQSSMPPPRESMNQMSGALLSLSQDLMQMMNFKEALRMEREREKLLSLSHDALSLSEWQEELQQEQRNRTEAARSQQALNDALRKSREAADSLSMLQPSDMLEIGQGFKNALNASTNVLDALGSSDGRGAMSGSSAALRSLANAMLAALSRMDNGQQSSGGQGGACMMPGLCRISGRQAAINSATADLLRQLMLGQQGQGMASQTGNGSAEAREAAQRAQAAIADELKKLSEQYGREAGEGMRGKVAELEEEARRLAAMLERPVPEIAERQDRYLARMLETTLSMHREGEGKDEWKSRTADKTFGDETVAPPGTLYKGIDAFHRLRQKAYRGNFPDGYRNALRAYFDALSEKYLK